MLVKVTLELLAGFRYNLIVFFATLVFAIPLGMVITFGEMSPIRPIRAFFRLAVWLIRGMPLMLQLFIVLYVPGLVFGMPFRQRLTAALIAFSVNYAAYFAEIYRGAIESIPPGQWEAGKVLGLSRSKVFFHIILFQVVRRSLPALGNEFITLVKDTSLARVIAVPEMLMKATEFTMKGLIWPLFYSGLFYLVATAALEVLFKRLERRFAHG
ncbi:MAG: amino acid ABC transporter permease [Lachnospiraceae bacterium]|jgi:polar amino acid transport system permease protein|nr:amino acid ABC transporter permease [Lachnospiraceae bacterium]